jgi:hypothetical protein
MDEENRNIQTLETGPGKARPVFLTMLCLFSFIYFALLSLLFLVSLFYSGRIAHVRSIYVHDDKYTGTQLLFLFFTAFLLHFVAFTGTFLIWFRRKTGFYCLASSCLIMAVYEFFQQHDAIGTMGVYIVLILFFGLYFRRLH